MNMSVHSGRQLTYNCYSQYKAIKKNVQQFSCHQPTTKIRTIIQKHKLAAYGNGQSIHLLQSAYKAAYIWPIKIILHTAVNLTPTIIMV